ncbi:hypothetical protein M9H77_16943 [Catharanthus roseus]|uniref:Uncharacterized protein n=1 Tax=Catharanthus roseus TaxID=4058 RepID=A0ACC0B367_CATRO|nr:hypothetical protein M9H77_16943 [Catharanthus roseus]
MRCNFEGIHNTFRWGVINATQDSIKINPTVKIQKKGYGRRRDDDLGPVMDRTGRVQSRTVTASSRGVRGRLVHPTSRAPGSSTQPPLVPFKSRPPHPSCLSHTPVPYEAYGSAYPHSQPPPAVYDPYLAAPIVRPHIPYRSSAQEFLTEFSSPARQLGAKVDDEDDGDGDDDNDDDDGEDDGDEEQLVPVAPVAYASGSNGRPRHEKGKGLTGSFLSVMSKITGSHNKRPDKARDVPAPTQRKRVKASDWEHGFTFTFLCSHLRLDRALSPVDPTSSKNIPRGFHVPVDPTMPDRALLDLIAREARRKDTGKEEKFDRIADLLSRHYRTT